ncbi:MAG: hypothetical protein ACSHX7_10390 [Luteolibacter sp.]
MTEIRPNYKLRRLHEILPKLSLLGEIGDDECASFFVAEALSEEELKDLDDGNLVIKKVYTPDNNPLRISSLHGVGKDHHISIEVPRDPAFVYVATDISDLLKSDCCLEKEPKEILVLQCGEEKKPYWSGQTAPLPAVVQSYRSALQLISILKNEADALTLNPTVATYFDVERIDIKINFTKRILSSAFPANELEDFLNQEGLSQTRRDAFRVTLWDKLKHHSPSERLGELLRDDSGNSFMRALKYNFRVAKKDFSLDRRLECARQEYRELAGNLSKLVSGLEAKAFVVPGTLLLAARFVEIGQGLGFKNLTICISASILAVILTIAYKTHKDIASEAVGEIVEAKKNLGEGQADEDISQKFSRLEHRFQRVQYLKFGIVILAWLVAIGLFAVCLHTVVPVQESEENSGDVSEVQGAIDTQAESETDSVISPKTEE